MSAAKNKLVSSLTTSNNNGVTKNYVLRLYVSGTTPHSATAIKNITIICEEYLSDDFDLEVIDIYQKPLDAKNAQIIAVPTLIKLKPEPVRRLCGDMSITEKVLSGLDLQTIAP